MTRSLLSSGFAGGCFASLNTTGVDENAGNLFFGIEPHCDNTTYFHDLNPRY
jgi:hypothetical protein